MWAVKEGPQPFKRSPDIGEGQKQLRPILIPWCEMKHVCLTAIFLVCAMLVAPVAATQESLKYSLIAVQYIGESDKQIAPIVISDSQLGAEKFCKDDLKLSAFELVSIHVVNGSKMNEIISAFDLYRTDNRRVIKDASKYSMDVAAIRVTLSGKGSFTLRGKGATDFLDDLKVRCNDDGALCCDIFCFQKRLIERGSNI